LDEQVGAVAREQLVRLLLDQHLQVAGRPAVRPRIAEPAPRNVVALCDARRDLDRHRRGVGEAALAAALETGRLDHLAGATAARTRRHGHELAAERGLHLAHLAAAGARRARLLAALLGARSAARFAAHL